MVLVEEQYCEERDNAHQNWRHSGSLGRKKIEKKGS
jgi:hypothetical protein